MTLKESFKKKHPANKESNIGRMLLGTMIKGKLDFLYARYSQKEKLLSLFVEWNDYQ